MHPTRGACLLPHKPRQFLKLRQNETLWLIKRFALLNDNTGSLRIRKRLPATCLLRTSGQHFDVFLCPPCHNVSFKTKLNVSVAPEVRCPRCCRLVCFTDAPFGWSCGWTGCWQLSVCRVRRTHAKVFQVAKQGLSKPVYGLILVIQCLHE